jgi:hypothetical protein
MKQNNYRNDFHHQGGRDKNSQPRQDNRQNVSFPYYFYPRKSNKQPSDQYHDQLNPNNYDVAFEIQWETKTPTALNPCEDTSVSANFPVNDKKDEFLGYNKRWLTINDKLAISSFTVKSAIANGFANLMGGCVRVMKNKVAAHHIMTPGSYPYDGEWKRYRVDMRCSKPGIVKKILETGGGKLFEIEPIEREYFLNEDLPAALAHITPHKKEVYARIGIREDRRAKPAIIEDIDDKDSTNRPLTLFYEGKYKAEMNGRGYNHGHKHRFYAKSKKSVVISGIIRSENFLNPGDLKKIVYMGDYVQQGRPTGNPWYDNLNEIKVDDFIYYESFNGVVVSIGKSYLFKPLFLHEDAVPESSKKCRSMNEAICPRCAMFGFTGDDKTIEADDSKFKGRFKSATLISDKCVELDSSIEKEVRFEGDINNPAISFKVLLSQWKSSNGKRVAYQTLLPIQATPKPNKRDVNGYYDRNTGEIHGVKMYKHSRLETAENIWNVNTKNTGEYKHSLRAYAQVCESGLTFSGTIGAENCTDEEVAALVVLLHTDIGHHAFKLGAGKAFGMGTVVSSIKKIWLRSRENYDVWEKIDFDPKSNILGEHIKGIDQHIDVMKNKAGFANKIKDQRTLEYPKPRGYWDAAKIDE